MPRHDSTVLRYEAWTLPWSGDFKRLVASIPVVEGSGRGTLYFREVAGDGSMDVDLSNFDRLDDIVSDTTSSLIRVFDGTQIIHEWVAERVSKNHSDVDRVASVSGPSLQTAFDKWIVYPWDYPLNPSKQPDWVYGGRNQITNGGFEDGGDTPTIYTIRTDATSGSFVLTDGTDTTASIAWDASASTVETRLENDLGSITDVLVTGEGTEDAPWEIEFKNPSFGVTLSLDSHTLNGDLWITPTQEGGTGASPAMKSQTISVGAGSREYGSYDTFEVTDEQAHTGTYSLKIDPGSIPPRYAGVQWVLSVKPGNLYQASIWVRPTSGTNKYRFVIRAPGGGAGSVGGEGLFIASDTGGLGGTSFPANTWTQVVIPDIEIPDGIDSIIFRFANVDASGNPAIFFVDDAELLEGQSPSTVGHIVTELMDDATTDHAADPRGVVLDWVDYSSFDADNDSSSVAWDQEISANIPFGFTYGQAWDDLTDLGYEWELVPKASPTATVTHDLHWYNKGNRDDQPATAINVRQGVTGGQILKRLPSFTATIVEGADGGYREDTHALMADFGRMEAFLNARELPDGDTFDLLINEALSSQAENRIAAQFTLVATHDHARPLIDYIPGDTVAMQLPPQLPKEDRRVHQVGYANTYPTQYTVVGSRVFMGEEAGGWELVRRLWRKFLRRDKDTKGAMGGFGGGAGFIDVAAVDAPEWEKAGARYICDGTDDHIEILAAMQDKNYYSEVSLSSGTFFIAEGWIGFSGMTVRGQGQRATFFRNQTVGTTHDNPSQFNGAYLIIVGADAELYDVGFRTTNDFQGTCIVNNYGHVHNISHDSGAAQRLLFIRGGINPFHDIRSWGTYNQVAPSDRRAMIDIDEAWITLVNVFADINGTAIRIDHFGNAAITGITIQSGFNSHEPGIWIGNAGYVAMGDVAFRHNNQATTAPAIQIQSYPYAFQLSNVSVVGYGYGIQAVDAAVGSFGIDQMDINNMFVQPRISGIDLDLGSGESINADAHQMTISNYRCDGSIGGAGWGIRINVSGSSSETSPFNAVIISDFHIEEMDEEGIFLQFWGGGTGSSITHIEDSIIHDGIISEVGKHGVHVKSISVRIHDVSVRLAGQAADNTYDAFRLRGTMLRPMIHDNKIMNENQLRYGINVVEALVEQAIIVGNSDDGGVFGTDALNDQGTGTLLSYPNHAAYGDNFFGVTDVDQIERVSPLTAFNEREREQARPITPVQS